MALTPGSPIDLALLEVEQLSAQGDLDLVTELVAAYVHVALGEHRDHGGRSWTVTAMPSAHVEAGEQRLATVWAGSVEVFAISYVPLPDGERVLSGFTLASQARLQRSGAHGRVNEGRLIRRDEPATIDCVRVIFVGLEGFLELLAIPGVGNAMAEEANRRIDGAGRVQGIWHNAELARVVLESVSDLERSTQV